MAPSTAPVPAPTIGARFPLAAGFAASSISVATAVLLTNWIDVIKVRQQLAGPEAINLLSTGIGVVRHEGIFALYRGVTPAVLRGMLYGGQSTSKLIEKYTLWNLYVLPEIHFFSASSHLLIFLCATLCRIENRPLFSVQASSHI